MSKKLEQILTHIPAEGNLNKNVAIIMKKMMEGIMQITEEGKGLHDPSEVINCITLAGAALVSDIADKSDDEAAQYVMMSEYAKQSVDNSIKILLLDLSSNFIERIDSVIGEEEPPTKGKKKRGFCR